jgi:putative PIN family toxin of toxin-antitoxin system
MIRVVADTNIYVSAILFGGNCEALLALARAGVVELFISPPLLRELRMVLTDTFAWPRARTQEALATLAQLTTLVRPAIRLSGLVIAEADHRVLECAVTARADFLVTGDKKHLLPLKSFRGVRILSPRAFLDELREQAEIDRSQ